MSNSTVRPFWPTEIDARRSTLGHLVARAVQTLDRLGGLLAHKAQRTTALGVVIVFGLASAIHFPFGPGFSLLVVAATLLLPISLLRALNCSWGRWLTATAVLWIGGQVLSNALHEDGVRSLVHQLWYPLMLAAMVPLGFLIVSWSVEAAQRAFLGMVLGHLAFGAVRAVGAPLAASWKFELAFPVLLLILTGADRFGDRMSRRALLAAAAGILSAVSLAAGARLWAGVGFAAALGIIVMACQSSVRHRLVAMGCLLAVLTGVYAGFVQLASGGSLGEDLEYRVTRQGGLSPRAVLAARPEAVFSASLIASSPLTGLGGRPELSENQVADGEDLLRSVAGRNDTHAITWVTLRGYNAHSLTLSFWVYGGLAAATFWIAWILFLGAGWLRMVLSSRPVSFVVLFAVPVALWDAFFSPWAPHYEVIMLLVLSAMLVNRMGRQA